MRKLYKKKRLKNKWENNLISQSSILFFNFKRNVELFW